MLVVDCSWGEWTEYGACSEECGGGYQTRFRIKSLESCNGAPCTGDDIDIQSCNTNCCPGKVVNVRLKNVNLQNLKNVSLLIYS